MKRVGPYTALMPRSAWIALALAICLGSGLAVGRLLGFGGGRILISDAAAPWVMAERPFSAMNRQWGSERARRIRFKTAWVMEEGLPDEWPLRLRVFGRFQVRLNGVPVIFDTDPDRRWSVFQKRDLASALKPGRNQLVIEVRNRQGPALISMDLGGEAQSVGSRPEDFQAQVGAGPWAPAVLAQDMRRHPANDWLPSPLDGVKRYAWPLVGVAALGAFLGLWSAALGLSFGSGALAALWCSVIFFWGLFWARSIEIPLLAGFDARGHLEVVGWLASGRLPIATDGWSAYHPPLYHSAVAALRSIWVSLDTGGVLWAIRFPAVMAGLGLVFWSGRLAGWMYPQRPVLKGLAIVFAALLPVNLVLAATVSNEGWLAFWVAGAVIQAARVLGEKRLDPRGLAWTSVWLGLALLTKYTAWVAFVVILGCVALRVFGGGRRRPRDRARELVAFLSPALLIAGWYYIRNWMIFGRFLVPNWDLPGPKRTWWSPPGFHSLDYYLSFGESLSEPFYSSFSSFWDGLYSTLWGDGLLSGAPGIPDILVPWDLEWMAVGYWAALPILALILLGAAIWARDVFVKRSDPRAMGWALPLVYAAAMLFAIFFATLALPFFGQSRAAYGLSVTPVLAVAFARGWAAAEEWAESKRVRAVLRGGLGACFAVWVSASASSFLG